MIKQVSTLLIFLLFLASPALPQGSIGVGTLPFEWSGHWGIYHRFGFPGWGVDIEKGSMFLDGNFAHWPQRYAFPFRSRYSEEDDMESGVTSSIWYRKGDYSLDEFAFDIDFRDAEARLTRFQAMKRSFDDQFGLLGPSRYLGGGGTNQQNYRLLMKRVDDDGGEWRLVSGYFKTTDMIPAYNGELWEKGVSRLDRIITNGIGYIAKKDRLKYKLKADLFSQRLKLHSMSSAPEWNADILSYRGSAVVGYSVKTGTHYFVKAAGKYSAISSDSLGNQSRLIVSAVVGLEHETKIFEQNVSVGTGFVSPDRNAIIFDVSSKLNRKNLGIFAEIKQHLQPLPYQFSGRPFLYVPDFFAPVVVPRIRPDSSAISQLRTVSKLGITHHTSRSRIETIYFIAQASPHYYFEKQWMFEMPDIITLMEKTNDSISGVSWRGMINYFRNWRLYGAGVHFIRSRKGWGTGVKHEGSIALIFQELLFREHLDARIKVWTDFWIGRDRFVWDPILNLGYYDYKDIHSQDVTGILNIEFKGVISSFEISYTMTNVLYTGRFFLRGLIYEPDSEDSLRLTATPLFPPSGRLVYITLRWNFND